MTAKGSDYQMNEMVAISVRPERMQYSFEPVEGFTIEASVKEQVYVGSILKAIVILPNGNEVKIETCRAEYSYRWQGISILE